MTAIEQVRLRAVGNAGDTAFTDEEVELFLSDENGVVDLAAARYCEAVAGQMSLVAKSQSSGQWSSNKQTMADAMLDRARYLRDQYGEVPYHAVLEPAIYPWTDRGFRQEFP